jgi:hypothetical protein
MADIETTTIDELTIALEMRAMLTTLDATLANVFKSHVPVVVKPFHHTSHEIQRVNLLIMQNLAMTMDELKNVNPMTLLKQLMGM